MSLIKGYIFLVEKFAVSGTGKNEAERLAEYRGLFRRERDDAAIADIRLALMLGRGNERFRIQ